MSEEQNQRDLLALKIMRKYKIAATPVYSPAVGWRWRINYESADLSADLKQRLAQWEWDVDTTADLSTLSFGFKVFNDPVLAILAAAGIIETGR